jgi:RNA polymerase sigma-70 factor (ECF subfamily)
LVLVFTVEVSAPTQVQSGFAVVADDVTTAPVIRVQFDDFYRTNYAAVVRLAYSLCGSMQVAEELAQEAFISAHARWRRLVAFERPDLWVRRAVINRSISFRRRKASERRALHRIRQPAVTHSDPQLSDEAVWQALRELSPRQAEVLALFYVEDQPLSEVALILGLGEETVKTHLKRGRQALAVKLDSQREGHSA